MSPAKPSTKTDKPAAQSAKEPVYSMTGFARVAGRVSETLGFSLSLKSVNHRFLDLHMRLPNSAEAVEMNLRRDSQGEAAPRACGSHAQPRAQPKSRSRVTITRWSLRISRRFAPPRPSTTSPPNPI